MLSAEPRPGIGMATSEPSLCYQAEIATVIALGAEGLDDIGRLIGLMPNLLFLGAVIPGIVPELELDGILKEPKEALLLFLLDDFNALAFVAAHAAKIQRLAALALHHMDTGVAHHLRAMRAFESNLAVGMAGAKEVAIVLDGFGFRQHFLLELGDGDGGVHGFHVHFHVAEAQFLAGPKPGFLDGVAIDKGAVGGVAVAQINTVMRQRQFAMQCRDGVMVQALFAVGVPSHMVHPHAQFKCLNTKPFSSD